MTKPAFVMIVSGSVPRQTFASNRGTVDGLWHQKYCSNNNESEIVLLLTIYTIIAVECWCKHKLHHNLKRFPYMHTLYHSSTPWYIIYITSHRILTHPWQLSLLEQWSTWCLNICYRVINVSINCEIGSYKMIVTNKCSAPLSI